ncbi:MAG TPA: hypothetical protein VNU70_12875, partial [Puia sp.]|nr:hypothetical protein [Puia sp.]
ETLNAHQLCVDNTGTMRLAVLPFIGCSWGESQRAFGDNLCVQLSSALMRLDKVAVIAYQVVQSAAVGNPDYRELSASFGLTHFLTGGAQRHKDVFRVSMQLIECHTYRQLWAGTIECGVTRSDVFDFQDAICNCAAKGVAELER